MTSPPGPCSTILVVDDDRALAETCARLFRRRGYGAEIALSADEALAKLSRESEVDLILSDIRMPGLDGVGLMRRCRQTRPDLDVVLMTGYGSIHSAVEAMKLGAADYLTKPLDLDEVVRVVGRLVEARRLRRRAAGWAEGAPVGFEHFVAESEGMKLLVARALSAARGGSTVLIVGETGTGKELIARAIHRAGPRSGGPFVPVNCAALPANLAESLLFGHRRGAFTGADDAGPGLFRAASGGTIFLDEVAEMPTSVQSKLLRCLESRLVRPVGDVKEVPVDVRVLAATNRDVAAEMDEGRLRKDLYFRLSVVTLDVPPLREHPQEIPRLLEALARRHARGASAIAGIEPDALRMLLGYSWPGNVRELANLVEGLLATGFHGWITVDDLPARLRPGTIRPEPWTPGAATGSAPSAGAAALSIEEAERDAIVRALAASGGNKSKAAEILGISRTSLYAKLRLYNLLS